MTFYKQKSTHKRTRSVTCNALQHYMAHSEFSPFWPFFSSKLLSIFRLLWYLLYIQLDIYPKHNTVTEVFLFAQFLHFPCLHSYAADQPLTLWRLHKSEGGTLRPLCCMMMSQMVPINSPGIQLGLKSLMLVTTQDIYDWISPLESYGQRLPFILTQRSSMPRNE